MTYDDPPPPLAAQANALRSLLRLAELHPELPGAYVVSHNIDADRIDVQLDNPSSFEAWREALTASPASVRSKPCEDRELLEFTAPAHPSTIRVYAIFPRLTNDAGASA
ncbi:hypothetical protein [Streptomyces sp. NPDC020917]|uniref:hypothetical protein n=1 Tax=Streptomyces sp. NPDC020917 TaxID=3365102 RepID=UPI003799FB3A